MPKQFNEQVIEPVRLISDVAAIGMMCNMFSLYTSLHASDVQAAEEAYGHFDLYRAEVMRRLGHDDETAESAVVSRVPAYMVAASTGQIVNHPDFKRYQRSSGRPKGSGGQAWDATRRAFIRGTLPIAYHSGIDETGRADFDNLADLDFMSLVGSVALLTDRVMQQPQIQTYHHAFGKPAGPATLNFLQGFVLDHIDIQSHESVPAILG